MKKEIKPWNLFMAENMNNLVDFERSLRNLKDEVNDAFLCCKNQAQKEKLAQMNTIVDAVQEKTSDVIKTYFLLDMNERQCENFITFQLGNGIWESDFLR